LEHGLGIRVLGELPPLAGNVQLDEAEPNVVMLLESIDSLRTALVHLGGAEGQQVVMVTSAQSGEGRTTVASQLAASLARAGKRTVIVDADMRHPSLHRLFDLPIAAGLCELLRGDAELARALRPTGVRGLWAIAAGAFDGDSLEALSQDQMHPIVAWLRADFDYVIIDAAPVLSLADALIVGQYCDGAILSTMRDETQAPKLYAASERLHGVGVHVLGAVVNGMPLEPHARAMRLGLGVNHAPADDADVSEGG
jgi:capsular exopolysaccharide synthesis family protein